MSTDFIVASDGLNLRSAPVAKPSTRIRALKNGQRVTKLAEANDPAWWKVSVVLDGAPVTGFVAHKFLTPAAAFTPPPPAAKISAIHLDENRPDVTRKARGGPWRFPLGESDRPTRGSGTSAARANALGRVVEYLNVEQSQRYAPTTSATFCNIYAYDYCYLGGAYLPRVWWTPKAIAQLAAGTPVAPVFGRSVTEQTANMLFDWLEDFGDDFGWVRTSSLDELQDAANVGELGIICAKRKDLSRSGHIVAVVPETEIERAARIAGKVKFPLQSQAGVKNHNYVAQGWWTNEKFREFGFWRHA